MQNLIIKKSIIHIKHEKGCSCGRDIDCLFITFVLDLYNVE